MQQDPDEHQDRDGGDDEADAAFLPGPVAAAQERLSAAQARRIALAAQGFGGRVRRDGGGNGPAPAALHRAVRRLGVLQIDSVNVLVRSHYLPLFSRLGGYDTAALDRAAWGRRKTLFEYWGHEASLLPVEMQPLFRWRMARASRGVGIYSGLAKFGIERRDFIDAVEAEIASRGPLSAGELSGGGKGAGGWWGWSEGKRAVEYLFWAGRLTTATRRGFERIYDLPERVLPADVLSAPTPTEPEAQRALLLVAARALGVATARDLRDYFRLGPADAHARLAELVEDGSLQPVTVDGWKHQAFLDPAARRPRRIEATALLSPFDSLIWERARTLRLFDFHYRLAFYTPAEKRTHGYYVLPVLLGDRLVGRVDLKADRAAGVLRMIAAHGEAKTGRRDDPAAIGAAVAAELASLAAWLGLGGIACGTDGDLAAEIARAVG